MGDTFKFDTVKFKTRTNCSLDKYPEIRTWLDTDAAQFTQMPILVASDGMSRLELVDTVNVHRYGREELNELLEEMGQVRDKSLTWEKVNNMEKFDNMLNNWGAYHAITKSDDDKAAEAKNATDSASSETNDEL